MMYFAVWEKKSVEILDKVKRFYEKLRQDRREQEQKAEFLRELQKAQFDVTAARNNYNFAQDNGLLEYYIYEIKAAETRLNYYLTLAKRENMCNDLFLPKVFVPGGKRSEKA